jgi:DNA polymerase-3 subunit alpha
MTASTLSPTFTHLRVHSEYSIVDGLVRIDDVVAAAARDKQGALAVTDLANLFCMVRFYKAARGKGIKPIIGVDAWISNDSNRDKPYRLLLLAKNHTGYLQLCDLLSRAWLTNQYKGRAELRTEWLEQLATSTSKLHPDHDQANGLIVLSGAQFGDIGARRSPPSAGRASFRTIFISRCSVPASPTRKRRCAIPWPWPRA